MTAAQRIVDLAWSRGLRPPPTMTVSEWADLYRWIPAPSPAPGKWRTARTPYLREIMDVCSLTHPARFVDFVKGTQLGGTEAEVNLLGYSIHLAPTDIMVILPTRDVAKEWVKVRIDRLTSATPVLAGRVSDSRDRFSRGETFLKNIDNGRGWIKIAWASSASRLRSTPAEILIADEVDAFDIDVEGEGDAIKLIEKRFANWFRGKFVRVSTPKREAGGIYSRFEASDRRYYFVPCPNCRHLQRLVFQRLIYQDKDPRSVRYKCLSCAEMIPEAEKTAMLEGGRWIATSTRPDLAEKGLPERELDSLAPLFAQMAEELHVGFHLPSYYSPVGWYSWEQLVQDWLQARGNVAAQKVFVMTTLGEVWRDRSEQISAERLYERRLDYPRGTVPEGGLVLVAGADVQTDRIEVLLQAVGRRRERWAVDYLVIPGNTETQEPWDKLNALIDQTFPHAHGGRLPIDAIGIDSGFNPGPVYRLAAARVQAEFGPAGVVVSRARTVIPTKGTDEHLRLIAKWSNADEARRRDGVKIVHIGTHFAKEELTQDLKLPVPKDGEPWPEGSLHYPLFEREFFDQVTSERKVVRIKNNVPRILWEVYPAGARNEALDTHVIARAVASLVGCDGFGETEWAMYEARTYPPLKKGVDPPDADRHAGKHWFDDGGDPWL